MPFKNAEEKKAYHRDYMRRRRKGLTAAGESTGTLNPTEEPRHTQLRVNGQWRRVAEQNGRIYDRDSGELLNIE